ncbi:AIPR family protein [Chlorogloeopsis sp. ULAP01]|uniref:AIPR family protein n=1 Tax=Chlorogloeopsis sp. ULAP01 TaxID=3056483 RepID=UPI0025AB4BC8|nr:AIPR family protein [Chlorogloeopsis sp. ULAP01]MDM9383563.1 AIPR family protein [Chlorogloeopsis sp. ULAP01]
MPKIYKLLVDNHTELISTPKTKYIVGIAQVANFPCDLPLSANVREPNPNSSICKQILDSLFVAPEKFVEKHSGIIISAHKVTEVAKGELEIEILEECEGYSHYGIANGGNSVAMFSKAQAYKYNLEKVRVKVTIHVGLTEKEVRDIALAANTNAPVDASSRINTCGDYDFIKTYIAQLESKEKRKFRIRYYQNQSGIPKNAHCSIGHILKLLNCLDCNRYNGDSDKRRGKHPTSLKTPSEINETEKERINRLLHLLTSALWIEQRLYTIIDEYLRNPRRKGVNNLASIDTKKNTLLPDSKYSFGFGAPGDLALPVVAAFRVFLDKEYQWIMPFEEFSEGLIKHLWEKHFCEYLKKEYVAGKSLGVEINRNQEIWENLYTCASLYLNNLYRKIINSKSNINDKSKPKLVLTS